MTDDGRRTSRRQLLKDSLKGKSSRSFLTAGAAGLSRAVANRLNGFATRIAERELFYWDLFANAEKLGLEPSLSRISDDLSEIAFSGGYLAGARVPFRPTGSDLSVVRQVLLEEEYRPLVRLVEQRGDQIGTIIDAGANIGLTSLYLKRHFSGAKVIAIEPAPGNFSLLERTVASNKLSNIDCVKAGLWPCDQQLAIDRGFRDHLEWSISLDVGAPSVPDADKVKGISMETLKREFHVSQVDILKIDIEGGERFLFSDADTARKTLCGARYIALEIHDEYGIRDSICQMLTDNGFTYFDAGETVFGFRAG